MSHVDPSMVSTSLHFRHPPPRDAGETPQQPPFMFTVPRERRPAGKDDYMMHIGLRLAEVAKLKKDKALLDEHMESLNAEKDQLNCMTREQSRTNLHIVKGQERKVKEMTKLGGLMQKRYDLTAEIHGIHARMFEMHLRNPGQTRRHESSPYFWQTTHQSRRLKDEQNSGGVARAQTVKTEAPGGRYRMR